MITVAREEHRFIQYLASSPERIRLIGLNCFFLFLWTLLTWPPSETTASVFAIHSEGIPPSSDFAKTLLLLLLDIYWKTDFCLLDYSSLWPWSTLTVLSPSSPPCVGVLALAQCQQVTLFNMAGWLISEAPKTLLDSMPSVHPLRLTLETLWP